VLCYPCCCAPFLFLVFFFFFVVIFPLFPLPYDGFSLPAPVHAIVKLRLQGD
jgi:hypothetical protein